MTRLRTTLLIAPAAVLALLATAACARQDAPKAKDDAPEKAKARPILAPAACGRQEARRGKEDARERARPGPRLGNDDTQMHPSGTTRTHAGPRPQPPVITPPTASIQDTPGKAPSDAVVLFDGT